MTAGPRAPGGARREGGPPSPGPPGSLLKVNLNSESVDTAPQPEAAAANMAASKVAEITGKAPTSTKATSYSVDCWLPLVLDAGRGPPDGNRGRGSVPVPAKSGMGTGESPRFRTNLPSLLAERPPAAEPPAPKSYPETGALT